MSGRHAADLNTQVMENLGLLEAWALWGQGEALNGMSLWGIPMIWWGRAGKIAAFLGGLTVVLDVIGPDRIREFGVRVKGARPERHLMRIEPVLGILGGVAGIIGFLWALAVWLNLFEPSATLENPIVRAGGAVMSVLTVVLSPPILRGAVLGFGVLLENKRTERVIRWAGVMLLVGGFHFDLLAG
jgi:hypothetical protein